MGLNASLTGKVYAARSFAVTGEGIRSYARATNEDNPIFNSEDPVAPPAFLCVASIEPLLEVMHDPELGVDMALLVHGEQEHRFFTPIRAGDVLQVSSRLQEVDLADTGHTFTMAVDLANQRGEKAAEVYSKMFIRRTGNGAKPSEPEAGRREEVATGQSVVDEDQTIRYAEASGDHNPIHLDRQAARASGFPGIVCHGMCTMAMASKVILDGICEGNPSRLALIRVQFNRPVFPGQSLDTTVWRLEGTGEVGEASYGFETVNARGGVVIKNGLAVVTDPA